VNRRIVGGTLYVAITVVGAVVAAWPVYASISFLVLAVVAALAGAGIAVLSAWRRWGGWLTSALLAGVFVLLVVPLAVPSRLGGPAEIVRGLGEGVAGVLLAWKDLVTVDLPVGTYRNLLVPALVVLLVGTCAALRLSWRSDRLATAAVPVGFGMLGFGLFFGRTETSAPWQVGPVVLNAPVETLLGVAGLTSALLWLAWRTHDERVQALQRAATAGGVRVSRRPSRADRRRTVTGTVMVVVALLAAVVVVPWAAQGADRDVLRSAAGPQPEIAAAPSPLSGYRALFAPAREDDVLFRVQADGALPERVRVATLDVYDGEIFRTGGVDAGAAFERVPSTRVAAAGEPVEVEVQVEELGGIWMPTVGDLVSAEFRGDRAAALSDGFYYSAEAAAGVQTAGGGWETGDAYRLTAADAAPRELSALVAPGADPLVEAPDNLRRWVEEHTTGSDGAALAGLVELLRERGFLSHALVIDDEEPPAWVAELSGYSFQPSASGHSLARIDTLFTRLLEREADPRAAASDNYVAAVGDDEQFAVAVALVAGEVGFPARVVVGARLSAADTSVPTCDEGVCRARDLAAWAEVQDEDGTWTAVDASPQWERSPSLEVTEQRDPENVTEVRPDSVEEVVPPEPVQEDSARDDDDAAAEGLDLTWLWPILRIAGIVLLVLAVLLGPFIAIVGAKAARRRGRRRAAAPAARIAGGWDEYVDAGVDAGRAVPRGATRSELAAAYATTEGGLLASGADRAVFSTEDIDPAEAEEFWRIVDAERRAMARERGPGRRLLAAVSLKSFVRILAPRTRGRVSNIVERGKRRAGGRGRTTSS
jgi:hypothetical protein